MAGNFGGGEDGGSSGDGKPPNPLSGGGRLSFGGGNGSSPRLPTLARHASLVFDGHGGRHAAEFACSNLPRFISEDVDFPEEIERVVASAFLQTDTAFADACSADSALASGTTALAALIIGRSLVVANAGDCRAVLCRRGKAIEMSRDHKPACSVEKKRIEASGGYIYDGYLNGLLNVARAIGDWHMEGLKDRNGMGPLSAVPEVMQSKCS
ncbi:Protein phosphatase 2C family protein [Dioscorea alata]|uniref:Protein phosphatase 2C family protein n=1 Tax=Dioscorea alata TaxID=55571 RepID=A0ACB7W2Z8_DIOAL|nr:Protein phosphatase 2C family protein [Dioscorea alata]